MTINVHSLQNRSAVYLHMQYQQFYRLYKIELIHPSLAVNKPQQYISDKVWTSITHLQCKTEKTCFTTNIYTILTVNAMSLGSYTINKSELFPFLWFPRLGAGFRGLGLRSLFLLFLFRRFVFGPSLVPGGGGGGRDLGWGLVPGSGILILLF